MQVIHVPGPPKEAFNKNRRISDLIRAQVNHLKHLEEKLPAAARAALPQHAIATEDDAARYIGPMTQLLLQRAATGMPKTATPITSGKRVKAVRPATDLAIAASGEGDSGKDKRSSGNGRSSAKAAAKKASSRGKR